MTRARVRQSLDVDVDGDVSPSTRTSRFRFEWQRTARTRAPMSWPHVDRRATASVPMHSMYGRRSTDHIVLPEHPRSTAVAVRVLDVVVASALLVACAPLMLVVAALVKASSRGPVLFRQARVGRHHQHFDILKFRTMTTGTYTALANDPSQWAAHAANGYKLPGTDRRITPIGRWLRISSIDELPQLFNVLAGQMSIVGVRPLVPAELGVRPALSQGLYGLLRPGMTGLWQVSGRSLLSSADRIALDDRFVVDWSLRSTLWIMARTPLAVAQANGSR